MGGVAAGPVGVINEQGADGSGVADDVPAKSDGFVIKTHTQKTVFNLRVTADTENCFYFSHFVLCGSVVIYSPASYIDLNFLINADEMFFHFIYNVT